MSSIFKQNNEQYTACLSKSDSSLLSFDNSILEDDSSLLQPVMAHDN